MMSMETSETGRKLRGASESIESRYGWWLAVVSLLMGSIAFAAGLSIPVLLKPLSESFGTGAHDVASIHMVTMFGGAFGGLALGRLYDRWGMYPLALFGAVATGVGLCLAAVATDILMLCIIYALLVGGCGQGVFFSPLTAALSQWFDRHRPLAISIVAAGQGLSGVLFPPVVRFAEQAYGWRLTLLAFGLISGLSLLCCALAFRRRPPVVVTACVVSSVRARLPRALMLRLGASLAVTNVATFMIIGHLAAAGEELGATPMHAAALVSVMLGASLVTRLGMAQWSARIGPLQVLVWACVLHVVGLAWLAADRSFEGAAIGAALTGLGFGSYLPGYAVLVRHVFPPQDAGRRIGEIYFWAFISAGAGSWLCGLLRDVHGSYDEPFVMAAILGATGLGLLLMNFRTLKSAR